MKIVTLRVLVLFDLSWKRGTCKLDRGCLFAHGEKELTAWNEHLSRMETEIRQKREEITEKKSQTDKRPAASSNKVVYLLYFVLFYFSEKKTN